MVDDKMSAAVEFADVCAAQQRLAGVAVRTPLLESDELNNALGGRALLKPECWQRTGSFKIRGAYNLMAQLDASQAARGVVAWSSGNHAQGVACAGRMLGIQSAIVMPKDAPRLKRENTQRLGGEVIAYDRYSGDREAIAREVAAERNAELVPSYDHAHIIAGQGTVGLEIAQQCEERGVVPDQVVICCGGGGLSSGSAIALAASFPGTRIYTVEPVDFDDTARSLRSGVREEVYPGAQSICDALQAQQPGELTFGINRKLLAGGLSVTDADVGAAMRFAFRHLRIVLEPGGAVALAAVLAGKIDCRDKVTAVVLSGGNVDADLFAAIQSDG